MIGVEGKTTYGGSRNRHTLSDKIGPSDLQYLQYICQKSGPLCLSKAVITLLPTQGRTFRTVRAKDLAAEKKVPATSKMITFLKVFGLKKTLSYSI
jgi:hypothetical protein